VHLQSLHLKSLDKNREYLLSIYGQLFARPGAVRIASAGFIARMPIAMDTIAIILFVLSVDKRYSIAGALTGVAALTTVISIPLWAKAADHFGQRRVLLTAVPIRVSAFIIFIVLVKNGAPIWSWFLTIIAAESASLSIGSMTRRRWMHMIDKKDSDLLSTSYVFESFLDEIVFIIGPVITTAVATTIAPMAGIILGITFLLIGAPLIAFHAKSDPGIHPRDVGVKAKSVMRNMRLQAVAIPLTIAGGSFSAVSISVVAFSDERGMKSAAGLLLGIWACGGAISAFINGAIRWKISHGARYLGYLLGMTTISFSFPFINNFYLLGAALFLQGMCIAPLLPNGLSLITGSVSESQMTQAISLTTAGIPLTGALASFMAGQIIDNSGARAGLWLPFFFLALSCLATIPYFKNYKR
jgi:MFS family permease